MALKTFMSDINPEPGKGIQKSMSQADRKIASQAEYKVKSVSSGDIVIRRHKPGQECTVKVLKSLPAGLVRGFDESCGCHCLMGPGDYFRKSCLTEKELLNCNKPAKKGNAYLRLGKSMADMSKDRDFTSCMSPTEVRNKSIILVGLLDFDNIDSEVVKQIKEDILGTLSNRDLTKKVSQWSGRMSDVGGHIEKEAKDVNSKHYDAWLKRMEKKGNKKPEAEKESEE